MNEVIKITPKEISVLAEYLSILLDQEDNPNALLFKSNNVSISIYSTGKVLFQGKDSNSWYLKISEYLNHNEVLEIKDSKDELSDLKGKRRIGIDESGKGDFFGPLVAAAFFIENSEQEVELQRIGVKDSKEITDKHIIEMAKLIKKLGKYETVIIGPEKYNELYNKIKNLNNILAWSHARCIENMLNREKFEIAISDQFGDKKYIEQALLNKGRNITLYQTHKAERDTAVAAASIIARETFINQLAYISEKSGYDLKKGASQEVIQIGKRIVNEKGIEYLKNIAKVHFKTFEKVIN